MVNETQKILGDDTIRITATTVRVPVFDSHSESVNVELKSPLKWKISKSCYPRRRESSFRMIPPIPSTPCQDAAVRTKYLWEGSGGISGGQRPEPVDRGG